MHRLLAHRPSPAMVVACIALAIALGGTSYAAIVLPRNSVGNKQLRANAVTSGKVRNGSLQSRDFRAGQLPRGPRGAQGPPGPAAESQSGLVRTAFASRDPVYAAGGGGAAVTVGAAATDLITLDVAAGSAGYAASSGVITATGPSRLVANGQAVLVNSAAAPGDASCRLALSGSDDRAIGNYVNVQIGPSAYVAQNVSAGADVAAGTYNVKLQCYGPSLTFHRGNLVVTLTPR
jgi:hypothetical protein